MKKILKAVLLVAIFTSVAFGFESKFLPGYEIQTKCSKVLHKKAFDICYDYKLKNPKFVVYDLYGNLVNKNNFSRKHLRFRPDYKLPRFARAYSSDLSRSHYDRGHNAPNAAFDYSKAVQKQTFLMSNIAPQRPGLNRYLWAKIERVSRILAVKYKKTEVINGSCGSLGTVGRHKVNIPAYWFKIIILPNGKKITFFSKNLNKVARDKIKQHLVPLEKVEKICHFKLIETNQTKKGK